MTMDKSAIQEIQKGNAVEAISKVTGQTGTPVVAVPDDFTVTDLERYMPGRSRFRGSMSTSSIADFVKYIGDKESSQCFVDADAMKAKVFFNLGTTEEPGHGDYTSSLQLKGSTPFKELLGTNGNRYSQKELAEWMEDWRDHIAVHDQSDVEMTVPQAVAAVRRITIKASAEATHDEQDFAASRSSMEQVEAKSDERMPSTIRFTCTPFEGLGERTFSIRLSILTSSDKPKLSARVVQLEKAKELMAEEFKECLTDQLSDKVAIFIGSFSVAA